VTNVTFSFETSPNTNPTRKSGGHGMLCPPRLKKWGARPPCPPPNYAHAIDYLMSAVRNKQVTSWNKLFPDNNHQQYNYITTSVHSLFAKYLDNVLVHFINIRQRTVLVSSVSWYSVFQSNMLVSVWVEAPPRELSSRENTW